jgi:hypothetical protein
LIDSAIHEADSLVAALESHRDFHFRRLSSRRIKGDGGALRFINDTGFCTAFTAGLGLPCLREAVAGEREPTMPEHIQHDYAIGMVWRLKDTLASRKSAYYGKALAGRPAFISLDLLPSFLKLRIDRTGYLAMYRRGQLAHCAKLVMDALSRSGPSETRALKLASGYSAASKRTQFDAAMKQLQESFLALKVEERYDPFTYVWDTLENRWEEALRRSRQLSAAEAAYQIVRKYFEVSGFGNVRTLARLLAITHPLIERAVTRLHREKFLTNQTRIPDLVGKFHVLNTLL